MEERQKEMYEQTEIAADTEEEAKEKTEAETTPETETENMDAGTSGGEAAKSQQPAVEPEGDALYEVDIQITTAALYDYFLRHVYTSVSGLLGTVIGILMVTLYFVRGASILYLIFGIIVVLYLPWSLFLTAKKQALQAAFQKPFHYAFYENGVEVSQEDVRQMQRWEDMIKAVSTSKSIILYTGRNAASIFPRKDLGEDAIGLIQIISTHMDPKKVRIKE